MGDLIRSNEETGVRTDAAGDRLGKAVVLSTRLVKYGQLVWGLEPDGSERNAAIVTSFALDPASWRAATRGACAVRLCPAGDHHLILFVLQLTMGLLTAQTIPDLLQGKFVIKFLGKRRATLRASNSDVFQGYLSIGHSASSHSYMYSC